MADLTQLLSLMRGSRKPTNVDGFSPEFLNDETLDPSVRAMGANSAMSGELQDRAFQADRVGQSQEAGALGRLLGSVKQEASQSPLVAQGAEVANQRAGDLSAINDGFTGSKGMVRTQMGGGTPEYSGGGPSLSPMQQREIYKRDFAEKNSPLNIANVNNSARQFEQGRQLNQANRTVMGQMGPTQTYADIAREQWDMTKKNLQNPNGTPGAAPAAPGIKSIGRNGVVYQNQPQVPQVNPNNLNSSFSKEMGYAGQNGDPFATFGTGQNAALEQSVRDIVSNSGMHPDSQQELYDILSDPEDRKLTFDQIVAKYHQDINDPDAPKVRQLLLRFRGF